MTAQPKPRSALTPNLLARKGDARPAMRPEGNDLGWNDMGEPGSAPPVLVERKALADGLAPKPVSFATAARIGRETLARNATADARAAFTLRLDSDRHLKLRLASALTHRSAQLLVTEALDAFLQTLPEIGTLMDQLPGAER